MAVAMLGAHLYPAHAATVVHSLDDILLHYRAGKARPAGTRIILVDRGKQWFSRDHVDVDPGGLVVDILTGERRFGAVLLCDPVLLWSQPADRLVRLRVFFVACHPTLPFFFSFRFYLQPVPPGAARARSPSGL